MLVTVLLLPIVMTVFGILFSRSAPKRINVAFGYRTAMSMKNRETWDFAHKLFGKLCIIFGVSLIPVIAVLMLCVIHGGDGTVAAVGLSALAVELGLLFLLVILTERSLKHSFDRDGNKITDRGEYMAESEKHH